jgi:hypothetical protein
MAPRILRMILQQGIKRQIRLMLAAVGYEVRELVRTRIGSLEDTKLKAGKWRRLKPHEIELLKTNPGKTKKSSRLPAGISAPPPPAAPKTRRPAAKKTRGSALGGAFSKKPQGPAKTFHGSGPARGPARKKAAAKTGRARPASGPRKSAAPGGRRPAAKKSAGRGRGR